MAYLCLFYSRLTDLTIEAHLQPEDFSQFLFDFCSFQFFLTLRSSSLTISTESAKEVAIALTPAVHPWQSIPQHLTLSNSQTTELPTTTKKMPDLLSRFIHHINVHITHWEFKYPFAMKHSQWPNWQADTVSVSLSSWNVILMSFRQCRRPNMDAIRTYSRNGSACTTAPCNTVHLNQTVTWLHTSIPVQSQVDSTISTCVWYWHNSVPGYTCHITYVNVDHSSKGHEAS